MLTSIFTVTKKKKQSKCPSIRDWLNEQGYSCTKNNLIHNNIFFIQSINECFSAILVDTENVVLVTMSEKKKMQNKMHNMIQFYFKKIIHTHVSLE